MPDVSRRTFFELAVGALAALPTLAGGLVLAPRPASADPDGTDADELAGLASNYVVIDVVAPWEVGFMVIDITSGKENEAGMVSYPPVEGATVVLSSRFNGKSVTGTTNENGVCNLDVRELSVTDGKQNLDELDDYYFNGSVRVTRDDWRTFETALVAVEGGSGLQVPMHPADDAGIPYPHLASFDEWDALYTANEFLETTANAGDHEIAVRVANVQTTGACTFELWVTGEERYRMSVAGKAGEAVEALRGGKSYTYPTMCASFKAPFLKTGDKSALPIDGSLKVVFTQGNRSWTWPLAAKVVEGVVDEPSGKEGQRLTPINTSKTSTTGLGLFWPNDIPLVGGGNLSFWTPSLPIDIFVNPFGLVQITLKSPSWGYLNDGGASDQNGWGKYPRKTVAQQWDKKVRTMQSMSDKTANLISKPGAIQQIDLFKSFSVNVNFQLIVLAQWNAAKAIFQGEVAGQMLASMNFTITENFFAGPVPVLITFSLDASLLFSLAAAAYSTKKDEKEALLDAVFDFSRWKWDYTNTGLTMTFNITPALSVGVGLRGVASISVKGAITLTLFLGVPFGDNGHPELPCPHFSAGWSAQVLLVLEMFLFTQSFALYNKPFSNFYDNWNGHDPGVQSQSEHVLHPLADLTLSEFVGKMEIVTDAMLGQTSEADYDSPLSAQAEEEPYDWQALRQRVETIGADGSRGAYYVYHLPHPERSFETQDEGGADGTWTGPVSLAADVTPGVAALGANGGIRPSSDVKILGDDTRHVFGDPRAKVVTLGWEDMGQLSTFLFRIGSVSVNGKTRTRVLVNVIDGIGKGCSAVIDFRTRIEGMHHDDLYDYDFDLAVTKQTVTDTVDYVTLAVISGRRASADGTPIAEASCDLVVSVMCIGKDDIVPGDGSSQEQFSVGFATTCISRLASEVTEGEAGAYHSLSNIQVTADGTDLRKSTHVISFLDRFSDTPEKTLGEEAKVNVGLMFVRWGWHGDVLVVPDPILLESVIGELGDKTLYEHVLYPRMKEGYTLMLRGAGKSHYFLMTLSEEEDNPNRPFISIPGAYGGDDSDQGPFVTAVFIKRCADYDSSVRLIACHQQDFFLTTYPTDESQLALPPDERDYSSWTLHKATWTEGNTPRLKFESTGPDNFNLANFGVNRAGTFIFWPQAREADEDRVWTVEGTEDVKTRPASYQIMGCRMRKGVFSDPFIVADLPSDTDVLTVLDDIKGSVLQALRTEFVDTGDKNDEGLPLYYASDIWYTNVPAVKCVTASACDVDNPFVSPGGRIKFHVAVRNDGNTFVSGCTLTLCVHKEDSDAYERVPSASAEVIFSEETLQESNYNRSDGKGGLNGHEDDYALPPGKTSVYAVTVTIPADWKSGDRKVLFVASEAVVAPEDRDSLYTQAEDEDVMGFSVEPGDYRVVQVRTMPDEMRSPEQRHMATLRVHDAEAGGMQYRPSYVTEGRPQTPGGSGGRRGGSGYGTPGAYGTQGGYPWGLSTGGSQTSRVPSSGWRSSGGGTSTGTSSGGVASGAGSASGTGSGGFVSGTGSTLGMTSGGAVPSTSASAGAAPASGASSGAATAAQGSQAARGVTSAGSVPQATVAAGSSGAAVPRTADPSVPTALGAGIAAAGAAVLAYERRRAKNEGDRHHHLEG